MTSISFSLWVAVNILFLCVRRAESELITNLVNVQYNWLFDVLLINKIIQECIYEVRLLPCQASSEFIWLALPIRPTRLFTTRQRIAFAYIPNSELAQNTHHGSSCGRNIYSPPRTQVAQQVPGPVRHSCDQKLSLCTVSSNLSVTHLSVRLRALRDSFVLRSYYRSEVIYATEQTMTPRHDDCGDCQIF